jgi:hypothetical protein
MDEIKVQKSYSISGIDDYYLLQSKKIKLSKTQRMKIMDSINGECFKCRCTNIITYLDSKGRTKKIEYVKDINKYRVNSDSDCIVTFENGNESPVFYKKIIHKKSASVFKKITKEEL